MTKVTKQSGATLFIGLMLLLAISIVSIAAMRTSILDLVMTNNKQQFSYCFEAAEQVVSSRFDNLNFIINPTIANNTIVAGQTRNNVPITFTAGSDPAAWVNSSIRFRTVGLAEGWSLDQTGNAYHFQIDAQTTTIDPSEANASGRGASCNHRVGFYRIAPNT